MTKRTEASRDLKRPTGSLADLVQVVLQEIELPFQFLHFLERGALRGNEETSILAADVPQKGNPDGCRVVRSAALDVQLTAPKTCMASPPRGFSSEPLRIGPHARRPIRCFRQPQ